MAFLDEAAQAVQRVCRDDAGDSQAQGPVDIKEKYFFVMSLSFLGKLRNFFIIAYINFSQNPLLPLTEGVLFT